MTDHIDRMDDSDDWDESDEGYDPYDPDYSKLELITDYLTGRLSPEQMAEVKLRLEEDEAFREFAWPLVLAWSVPPRWKREPMPRPELEAMWDDFQQRVGLAEQRREIQETQAWWPWVLGAVAALAVIGPWVANDLIGRLLLKLLP